MKKLIAKCELIFKRHREVISYIFFGGLTTLVNFVVYFIASWGLGLLAWLSTTVSWVVAVAFAFITNKIFVFRSKEKTAKGVFKESVLFIGTRLFVLMASAAAMFVFVDTLELNEPLIFTIVQIAIIIFNYVAGKLLVFKGNQTDK